MQCVRFVTGAGVLGSAAANSATWLVSSESNCAFVVRVQFVVTWTATSKPRLA